MVVIPSSPASKLPRRALVLPLFAREKMVLVSEDDSVLSKTLGSLRDLLRESARSAPSSSDEDDSPEVAAPSSGSSFLDGIKAKLQERRERDAHESGEVESDDDTDDASRSHAFVEERRSGRDARRLNGLDGQRQTLAREVCTVLLSSIRSRAVKNIRLERDVSKQKALQASIAKYGMIHPPTVRATRDDRYELVQGEGRVEAARALGWKHINVTVLPVGTDNKTALAVVGMENCIRSDVSGYEMAVFADFLVTIEGMSQRQAAEVVGLSESRVSHLRSFLGLPLEIVEDWENDHPLLKTAMLERLSGMSQADASAYWADYRGRLASPKPDARERIRARRGFGRRPGSSVLAQLYVAVRRKPLESLEEAKALMVGIVEFCQGTSPTVPGLYDPKRPLRGTHRRSGDAWDAERELPLPTRERPEFSLPLERLR